MSEKHPIFSVYMDGKNGPQFALVALACTLIHVLGSNNLEHNEHVLMEVAWTIGVLCFFLVLFLVTASKAERRMFLPTKMVVPGLLARCFWFLLLVFYCFLWFKPEINKLNFPDQLSEFMQVYTLVPALVYGIIEVILWAGFLQSNQNKNDSGSPVPSQSNSTQEPAL